MRNLTLVAIFLILPLTTFTQDFHFVQSQQALQILNPAVTGSNSLYRNQITAFYRGQWDNTVSQKSYQGGAVSVDIRFCLPGSKKNFFGLGTGLQYDFSPLGMFFNTAGSLAGSYHQHLGGETFGAMGASLGLLSYGVEPDQLQFDIQYQNGAFDPSRSNGESFVRTAAIQPDLAAGFMFYNNPEGWSFGISWRHLNKPVYSLLDNENRLGIGFMAHGHYTFWKGKSMKRNLLVKAQYRRQSFTGNNSAHWQGLVGPFYQLAIAGRANSKVSFGTYMRLGSINQKGLIVNTLIPVIQLGNGRWNAGVSYDINTVQTRSRFSGGLELWLNTNFGKSDRCISCSKF